MFWFGLAWEDGMTKTKTEADSSAALRNDKQKNQQQQQMRGFFASLRMTSLFLRYKAD
jgi:hypothetical protein